VAMLRDVYGFDGDNLTYTPFMGAPSLLLMLKDHSVRVDDFGDGTRYFLRLLMLLSYMENGILLMEEPETAHHAAALQKLAERVVRLAHERNLQVFATTHSSEAINLFAAACRESKTSFALVHTRLTDGLLTARTVDAHDTEVLLDMGVDPRMAADH
jgi:predicted ATPase